MRWLLQTAVLASPSVAQAPAPRLVGVYDRDTGRPLSDVEVAIIGSGVSLRTSASGLVQLSGLPAGAHALRLRKLGYEPHTEFITLSRTDTAALTLVLRPLPFLLPEQLVLAREVRHERRLVEFLSRKRASSAPGSSFITAGDLEKWGAVRWSDALARTSGVQTSLRGGVRVRGCARFALYLDGAMLADSDLDAIPLSTVAAVEVYRGAAQVPPQYNATGRACGAVLVWTK